MIKIRKSEDRGHLNHGWLDTYHTFSFDQYFDPAHSHWRALRVINEDRVIGGKGFPTHSHRDSMGTGSVIRPGDVQRMTAGTGVSHSEFNPSPDEAVHLLQIWILPLKKKLTPGYEQKFFSEEERTGRLRLIASEDGQEGSVQIHQDARLYAAIMDAGNTLTHELPADRFGWLQVARGSVGLNDLELRQGDGAAISQESELKIAARDRAEVLLFDLA
jgi:redox-sensitive bicupin YhaK (pirin superfamily)